MISGGPGGCVCGYSVDIIRGIWGQEERGIGWDVERIGNLVVIRGINKSIRISETELFNFLSEWT